MTVTRTKDQFKERTDADYDAALDLDTYSFPSKILFLFTSPVVRKGYRNRLNPEDIWYLSRGSKSDDLNRRFWKVFNEVKADPKLHATSEYIIWRIIWRMFYPEMLASLFLHFLYSGLQFVGPLILTQLIAFVEGSTRFETWQAYCLALALGLSQIVASLLFMQSEWMAYATALKVRSMLTSAIFDKVLKLDNKARQQTSQGQVTTLLSTDAQSSVELFKRHNRTVMAPFLLVAGLIYIYAFIGPSTFGGLAIMVLFIPFTIVIGKLQIRAHKRKMGNSDARIKYVKEILQGIKIVKLYAWEKPILQRLREIRAEEVTSLLRSVNLRAITMPLALTVPSIASVMAFTIFLALNSSIKPSDAFTVVSLFVLIRSPFMTIPMAMQVVSVSIVAYRRIGNFLYLSSIDDHAQQTLMLESGSSGVETKRDPNVVIELKHAYFQWQLKEKAPIPADPSGKSKAKNKKNGIAANPASLEAEVKENKSFKLRDVNLSIKRGELVAVVGRVGSGKSSLLSALLGEMPMAMPDDVSQAKPSQVFKDKKLFEHVALCEQEPFIFNATVKNNIVFRSEYQQQRYRTAIDKSSLLSDLEIFPAGDGTEIGERGVTLSGGQKARVAIARAVYSDLDLYFFDDPLSAVDAHVANSLFNNVFGNEETSILKNKTRILVTNQVNFLPYVDKIIVMEHGTVIQQGTYQELLQQEQGALKKLLEDLIAAKKREEAEKEKKAADVIDAIGSDMKPVESSPEKESISKAFGDEEDNENENGKLTGVERRAEGVVKSRVVIDYWLYGCHNSYILAGLLLSTFFICEAEFLMIDSWLAVWSQNPSTNVSVGEFIGIYWSFVILYLILIMIRSMGFAQFGVNAGKKLYNNMNNTVILLPMSFFWKTPLGTILNRLSQDTFMVDEQIPMFFQFFLMTFVRVIGTLIYICVTAPIFVVVLLPVIGLYFLFRNYYRATSRELMRIEAITRSPLFNQLGESFSGMTTLRAYNVGETWSTQARVKIEHAHRSRYAVDVAQLWLQQRLEFLGGMIILLCALCIVMSATIDGLNVEPGLAGLALSQALNITVNLSFSVMLAVQLEASLNAVERVKEYADLQTERLDVEDEKASPTTKGTQLAIAEKEPTALIIPQDDWPSRGAIEFQNIWLSYRENLPPALRDASLKILPGETVGLVGRTGAGKSTILMALFRIVELSKGRVVIDDIDISKLSLTTLRSRLTLIPQDPVLFVGTMRSNLDPFNRYTDAELYSALDRAHLREMVDALPDKLSSEISENGANLSVGQRSLVCLARALLRKSKVVLLDEATASVDSTTDKLIQKTIRDEFRGHVTLIVIAHRLQTIIDSDKIAVLSSGKIIESGHPHQLLNADQFMQEIWHEPSKADFKSEFASLVHETGHESETKLREIAKDAYERHTQLASS